MPWQRFLVFSDWKLWQRFHFAFVLISLFAASACGPNSSQLRSAERAHYACSTEELRTVLTRHLVAEFDSTGKFGEWIVGPDATGISWSGGYDIRATMPGDASSRGPLKTQEAAPSRQFLLPPPPRGQGYPPKPANLSPGSNGPKRSGKPSIWRRRKNEAVLLAFGRIVEDATGRTIEIKGRVLRWRHGNTFSIEKSAHADDLRDRLMYAVYKDLKQCRR